ncbi:MAG TPA: hypothetical protein VFU05_17745 [Cyclobacteriaceae bacterium]|nr:hypothetical protein [Cyclobacteriaceae bacterium]
MKRTTHLWTTILTVLTLLTFKSCIVEENDLRSQNCGNSCATVNGIITTNDGTKPLTGVEITAKWINTVNLGGGTIRKKATTHTDNFGNYTLSFQVREEEMEEGYFIFEVLTGKDYFRCNENEYPSFSAIELKNDTTINMNLYVPYVAHLNAGLTGLENASEPSSIQLEVSPTIQIGPTVCGQGFGWYSNMDEPNWVYKINVPANQNLIIETVITKGEVRTRKYDTLYINKGQTVDYTAILN